MADIVLVHHLTIDDEPKAPGERLTVDDDYARALVRESRAVYATAKDADAAGDPDGPTTRRDRKGADG